LSSDFISGCAGCGPFWQESYVDFAEAKNLSTTLTWGWRKTASGCAADRREDEKRRCVGAAATGRLEPGGFAPSKAAFRVARLVELGFDIAGHYKMDG